MGGGRAPAEKGSTTRQMFKELRSKFNDAAKEPGFFDKGIQPEIELYCKANADGTQIGDCPFLNAFHQQLLTYFCALKQFVS